MQETVAIVDGHSLMYRAFHALPVMDADGVYTNAVHGFLSMLLRAIREHQPQYAVVAFDEHGPTMRHEAFEDYKANRSPMPEELRPQFPLIKELLTAMGIGVISAPGYEADDLLGTLARQANEKHIRALLITGDRDALQLVGDDTSLLFTRRGISDTVLFTPPEVKEAYGVTPEQVVDLKGLMGDSADNIPGVPGVGVKTALKLLGTYGSMDQVLAHAHDIKGKLGERLRENADLARLSRELATIHRDAPVQAAFGDWRLTRLQQGLPAVRKYQLNIIAGELTRMAQDQPAAESEEQTAQTQQLIEAKSTADVLSFCENLSAGELCVYLTDEELTLADPSGRLLRLTLASGQQDLFASHQVTLEDALKALSPILMKLGLITHDAKRFFHRLQQLDLPLPQLLDDTMILAYLHNPQERTYALQNFAAPDAGGVCQLLPKQLKQLKEDQMEALYRDIELPLVRVLFEMEVAGFQVDAEPLAQMGRDFTQQTAQLEEDIYRLTGVKGFNINSPQQLGKVLFEDLGLPSRRKTRTGWSTDADTLESLREMHPAIDKILEYRQIVKLNGTYVDGLLRKIDHTHRIHTTFDQVGTATGRISSNEPNLQNIPIRTAMGREIRRAFSARPGHVLVDGDYSQIELRVLAHISGDEAMCDAFNRGQDIHTRTAAEINGVSLQQVTPDMRSDAKAVNFGIVYGISDFGLANNLGISLKRAGDFIARYFQRYPQVHAFMEAAKRDGYLKGYATTLFGRRRRLEELKSSNANRRAFGERVALNTPIQGTAADIIKAAMVAVHRQLVEKDLKARLILQVHDELLIEAPEAEKDQVVKLLRQCMEQVIQLKVPLVADIQTGRNWYETN